jgi:hypothetical protein
MALSNMVVVRYYHGWWGLSNMVVVGSPAGWMLDGCLSLGPGTPGLMYLYKPRIEPGPASITGILQTGANSGVSYNNTVQYKRVHCATR